MSSNIERVKRWRFNHRKVCPKCSINIIAHDSKTCRSCSKNKGDVTIGEVLYGESYNPNSFSLIRWRSRRSVSAELSSGCEVCGYRKHVEVCHIKPVSDFSRDTKMSVVNDRGNLIILCPNCHWEFDNGLLNDRKIIQPKGDQNVNMQKK